MDRGALERGSFSVLFNSWPYPLLEIQESLRSFLECRPTRFPALGLVLSDNLVWRIDMGSSAMVDPMTPF